MFCRKCGTQLSEQAKFCPKCGVAISVVRAPVAPEQKETKPIRIANSTQKSTISASGSVRSQRPAPSSQAASAFQSANPERQSTPDSHRVPPTSSFPIPTAAQPFLLKLQKKKRLVFLLVGIVLLAVIAAVAVSVFFSNDDNDEVDVIADLKEIVFEGYGSQTLEEAANSTLSDVQWSCVDTPTFDGGTVYNASLTGTVPSVGTSVSLNFKMLYKYKRTAKDSQDITATVESITVDGKSYRDNASISAVLNFIYGNSDMPIEDRGDGSDVFGGGTASGIKFENGYYSLTLPDDWEERAVYDETGAYAASWDCTPFMSVAFYEIQSYNDYMNDYGIPGGFLFELFGVAPGEYVDIPETYCMGVFNAGSEGTFDLYVSMPSDVNCSMAGEADWRDMMGDIDAILDTFAPHLGYIFTPAR